MDLIDKALDLSLALGAEAKKLLAKCQGHSSDKMLELLKAHHVFEEARRELGLNFMTLLQETELYSDKTESKGNIGQNSAMRLGLNNICQDIQDLLDAVREEVKKKDYMAEQKQQDLPTFKHSEGVPMTEENAAENDNAITLHLPYCSPRPWLLPLGRSLLEHLG